MIVKKYSALYLCSMLLAVICFTGCYSSGKLDSMTYFRTGDSVVARTVLNTQPLVQPGDRLQIVVTGSSQESVSLFNTPADAGFSGYLVDADSTIHLPRLGKLFVGGLRTDQVADLVTKQLQKYLTDPIVRVAFTNFKITVLGEVNRPGTMNVPEGKLTLTEAIGMAGDLNLQSRRDEIMVIREKNGVREFGQVNLLSKDVFNSPYFVLQQNDLVYVKPSKSKLNSDQSFARNLSLVSMLISVVSTLVFLIVTISR